MRENGLSGCLLGSLALEIEDACDKVSDTEDLTNNLCCAVPKVATSPMWLLTFKRIALRIKCEI